MKKSAETTLSLLERAAARKDDPKGLLADLVAAWRATRHPDIAALVEKAGPPAELVTGKVTEIVARLEKLASQPADPRVARAAIAIFETQPFRSQGARKVYPAAAALIDAMRDPRSLALLEDVKKNRMPGLGLEGGTDFRDWFARQIDRVLALAAKIPPATELTKDEKQRLAAIAEKLDRAAQPRKQEAGNEDALLQAIWAAPDDDAPRLVYADFLTERNKPHGEFIALQIAAHRGTLDKAGRTRMRALQKAHAREFFGPLAPAVTLTNVRFERGFVAHCELADKVSPEIKALERHPAWATVRSFFAFTGKKIYPAMIRHIQSLGAKGFFARPPYLKQLPEA